MVMREEDQEKKSIILRTWAFGILAMVSLVMIVVVGVIFYRGIQLQTGLSQTSILFSDFETNQLHREVMRLLVLVRADSSHSDSETIDLQIALTESRFSLNLKPYFTATLDSESKEVFSRISNRWNALQPKLLAWRNAPTENTLRNHLSRDLEDLEIIINDLINSLELRRVEKVSEYNRVYKSLFRWLVFIGLFFLIFIGFFTYSMYRYNVVRESLEKEVVYSASLKKLNKELRRAKEEADSANRARKKFLSTMSHEFRVVY